MVVSEYFASSVSLQALSWQPIFTPLLIFSVPEEDLFSTTTTVIWLLEQAPLVGKWTICKLESLFSFHPWSCEGDKTIPFFNITIPPLRLLLPLGEWFAIWFRGWRYLVTFPEKPWFRKAFWWWLKCRWALGNLLAWLEDDERVEGEDCSVL